MGDGCVIWERPDLTVPTDQWPLERCIAEIRRVVVEAGYLPA